MGNALTGAKGQPVYNTTPGTVADFQAAADYAAATGNMKVGTTTQMNALSGVNVWEGLMFSNTTDGYLYRYVGGGWILRVGPRSTAITYASSGLTTGFGTGAGKIGGITTPVVTNSGLATWATSTFTIVLPGIYRIDGKVALNSSTGVAASLRLMRNGTNVSETAGFSVSGAGSVSLIVTETLSLANGDTLELWQIASGSNTGQSGPQYNRFSLTFLGPA